MTGRRILIVRRKTTIHQRDEKCSCGLNWCNIRLLWCGTTGGKKRNVDIECGLTPRPGDRLAKDRGHNVCTWVSVALYSAEWGPQKNVCSVCVQESYSWETLIFIHNWGNDLISFWGKEHLPLDRPIFGDLDGQMYKFSWGRQVWRNASRSDRLASSLQVVLHAMCFLALQTEKDITSQCVWEALHQDPFP